jgi:hypothetical protein
LNREEIKEQIKTWLAEEIKTQDWKIIHNEDDPYYYYWCTITRTRTVIQKIEKQIEKIEISLCTACIEKDIERVILFNNIKFSKSDSTNYKLSLEKEKFWYDVRLRLMPLRVNINAIPDIENIEQIELRKIIYFDGWSRDRFMNDFFTMIDAAELVELLFIRFSNYMKDKVHRD